MLLNFRVIFLVVFLYCSSCFAAAQHCKGVLPNSLVDIFQKNFHDYRLIEYEDYRDDELASEYMSHVKSKCITRKKINNRKGFWYAFLAENKKTKEVHGFVVIKKKDWKFVNAWPSTNKGRSCCFVGLLPPGFYERSESIDGDDVETGELLSFRSRDSGVIIGTIGAGGKAFFLNGNSLIHIYISD